eukprot:2768232-Rhodomonas_salina.2
MGSDMRGVGRIVTGELQHAVETPEGEAAGARDQPCDLQVIKHAHRDRESTSLMRAAERKRWAADYRPRRELVETWGILWVRVLGDFGCLENAYQGSASAEND